MGRPSGGWATLLVVGAAVGGSCQDAEEPWISPIPFDTAEVWVHKNADSIRLLVELAVTPEQRSFGLMDRPHLDSLSGMLFLYDEAQPGDRGFWMFRTRMPLDIAFLDSAGVINRILTMQPCPSDQHPRACPSYPPGVPYWSALEVNAGWFRRHGVGVGVRVGLPPEHGGD